MLRKVFFDGILAGLAVSLGGAVFMACNSRYVGAALFSVALYTVCCFGFYLYTGKIGYIVESHTKNDFLSLIVGLIGNAVGAVACGLAVAFASPAFREKAVSLAETKLAVGIGETFVKALFCGILMYISVWIYKEKKTPIGIFVCIPTFILSGFEHSVANMFYFSLGNSFTGMTALYVFIAVLGNTVGGILIPLLLKAGGKGEAK